MPSSATLAEESDPNDVRGGRCPTIHSTHSGVDSPAIFELGTSQKTARELFAPSSNTGSRNSPDLFEYAERLSAEGQGRPSMRGRWADEPFTDHPTSEASDQ